MSQTVLIHLVPAPCLLKLLCKLNNQTLCRFRRTCKKMDEYVESRRWEISKCLLEKKFISHKDGWYIHIENMHKLRNVGIENMLANQNFLEFIALLTKLQLRCHSLKILLESQDNLEKVIDGISFTSMEVMHSSSQDFPLEQLLSLDKIKNLKQLGLQTFGRGVWTIPHDGILKYFKNVALVNTDFSTNFNFCVQFAEYLVKEILDSDDLGKLSTVQFKFLHFLDPSVFLRKFYLVYRESTQPNNVTVRTEVLAQELPSYDLVLYSLLFGNMQLVHIKFCRKDDVQLRKVIEGSTGKKIEHLNHIVQMIHSNST